MKPRLVSHEDEDVSDAVRDILEKEGITIRTDAECIHFKHDPANPEQPHVVCTSCTTAEPNINGSHVLLAIGRTPNTDDLSLDKAGVKIDEKGYITVDDHLRTNVPASSPSATATAAEPSPTPPTTTSRSSLQICLIQIQPTRTAKSPTASPATPSTATRRWAASA